MASASNEPEDIVVFELTDPSVEEKPLAEGVTISISDIHGWDLSWILCHRTVKVEANRTSLVQESSYFRGLLSGSFSESCLHHISIQWNIESFLSILQFIYGCQLNVNPNNLLLLLEAALFFGVDSLLLECETWFLKFSSTFGPCTRQISLTTLIEIWKFGVEHGITSILETCTDYLAKNFVWAASSNSFTDIPYLLLDSAVEHTALTVESEMQLCEALVVWLSHNVELGEYPPVKSVNNYYGILKKVRISLLPLGFATGKKRCFPNFADDILHAILSVINDYPSSLLRSIKEDAYSKDLNIRFTEYSEKIVLMGCPQITMAFLFLGILPNDMDSKHKENFLRCLIELDHNHHAKVIAKDVSMLCFEAVLEVHISKCPKLHFSAFVTWIIAAFPSLRILKASYCLKFEYENLYYLLRKCPLIDEIDLTVDITPVIPTKVSVLSECSEEYRLFDGDRNQSRKDDSILPYIDELFLQKHVLANISSLILEGRNDMNDLELLKISSISPSLSNLNIKGCTLLSDLGISNLLVKCRNIQSLIASYTAFGRNSVLTLCSSNLIPGGFHGTHANSSSMALRLQQLQIDGCKGVHHNLLVQLMNQTSLMKILSLKETALDDDALYRLTSHTLETIDVSDTLVSMDSLHYVLKRNPNIRYLRATGCRNLHQYGRGVLKCSHGKGFEDFLDLLSKRCILEELALGWGFFLPPLEKLEPAFSKLKAISLGIGAAMDQNLLRLIPKVCPLLESVVLRFQVISDDIIRSIVESLKNLQVLWLCCCLGDLTSLSFCIQVHNLTILKLDWVTSWMTNNDLAILAQNCSNVVELSLSGCKLLDSDSQEIISSGWSGLSSIHLEECGRLTSKGVSFLFSCIAIEELLLRHNGGGLARNFITEAASKLPLLRKLSLDLCDASEGGFDSPCLDERFSLGTLKICRCKAQKCGFELEGLRASKPVHKETIVLEWTSKDLRTTVVRERL